MKLRHFGEIIVFYALLAAANHYLFPRYPGFIGVDPSPYWIGTLLFGLRYGVAAGMVSGLVSAAIYLSTAWFRVERYQFEDLSFYILPSLFVVVGTLIGVGVYQYREYIRELKIDREGLQERLAVANADIQALKTVNAGLEKRVVTRMQTMITLYEGALSLDSVELDSLYSSILKFIAKTLQTDAASIYVKNENGWELHDSVGWKEYERHPTHLQPNEGLTGLAGSGNKIVSIRDFIDQEQGTDVLADAVIAGPIHAGERGEVVAVLSIQSIPFLQFNSATISLLSFLLNWSSHAVGRAIQVSSLKEGEIWDPVFQVFSERYFELRSNQEWLRSRTYYLPLSVGFVRVNGLNMVSKDSADRLLVIVAELLRETCREVDVVARHSAPDIPFAFLLITASADQASHIRSRMLDNFDRLGLSQNNPAYKGISLDVGMSNFTPQVPNLDTLSRQAMESLNGAI